MAVNKFPDPQEKPAPLGPKEIVDLAAERASAYAERNAAYESYLTYYLGRQKQGGSSGIIAMNGYGKPILRHQLAQAGEKSYMSNRLMPVVDDFTALLGRLPIVRVDTPDPSDAGETKAILQTKFLYSTYRLCSMEYQQGEMGFFLSGLGDGVYMEEVDWDSKRVTIQSVDPRYVYPSFYRGFRRAEVYDAIVAYQWNPDDIEREFGYEPKGEEDSQVIIYVSPHQRSVVVGIDKPELVAHVEWDLDGHCPLQWVFNKANGNFGNSDISGAISQQDLLDHLNTIAADAAVFATYPIIGLRNAEDIGEGAMGVGPGETVNLGEDGDIKVIGPQIRLEAFNVLSQRAIQEMMATTGSSQVRMEGQVEGSIITGRAIQSMQGPESTRLDMKRQLLGSALERANALLMRMQEKAPMLGEKEIEIDGRYKGMSFVEKFQGKRDIDGWYRNTVTFDDLIGVNQQQKLSLAAEGVNFGFWDDLTGMEIVGVEDPPGMREKIKNFHVYQAQMQQDVAQGAQGGQGAQMQISGNPNAATPQMLVRPEQMPIMRPAAMMNAGGGAPPTAPAGPGANMMGGGGPVQAGALPTPPPGALPTGVPVGVSRKAVAAALQGAKLRGEVFALGDLAKTGQATNVQIAITDPRDYDPVKEALAQIAPNVKPKKIDAAKMPPAAVRIA